MKRIIIVTLAFFLFVKPVTAQFLHIEYLSNLKPDSLKRLLLKAKEDTIKVNLYDAISWHYVWSYPDSAVLYITPGLKLAQKLNFVKGQLSLLGCYGCALGLKGNFPQSLHSNFERLKLAEKFNDPIYLSEAFLEIGDSYEYSGDDKNAILYFNKAKANTVFFQQYEVFVTGDLGQAYLHLNLDSALFYTRKSYDLEALRFGKHSPVDCIKMGEIYEKKGDHKQAIYFIKQALKISHFKNDLVEIYFDLANIYKNTGQPDSSIYYASKSLNLGLNTSLLLSTVDASSLLTSLYKSRHLADSALKYQDIMLAAKDRVFNREKITQVQNFAFDEQMRQQEILAKQEQYRNNVKMYALLAVVAVFIFIAILLWRNNRHKQAANEKIQKTLAELKATQTQLIQSEKMASLGELTAGIAHEIQNPLNFVNNFSEVSVELLDEMDEELDKGGIQEAKTMGADLKQNLQKIQHHGKRADFIVKGMLEHSRTNTGEKQPTDMNVLCDEFLKFSYHGLRAKDKSFNAEMVTHFDPKLPKVNVSQQDMGRVMLNLFNNAFYAVNQKLKTAGADYKPEVLVTTSSENGQVVISVKDNGIGIPDSIKDKIMQPFFTTKPTGEGTGLGLSLTYDMVVKGHAGGIKVNSKEGEGSEFVISLTVG